MMGKGNPIRIASDSDTNVGKGEREFLREKKKPVKEKRWGSTFGKRTAEGNAQQLAQMGPTSVYGG